MPHAMKKAGARAKTILIKLVEGGKLFPGSLDRVRAPLLSLASSAFLLRNILAHAASKGLI